jgi:hypothetical protein
VVDVAAAELAPAAETEMVTVRTVDYRGKPPYRRRVETLPVVDTAVMDVEETAEERRIFRGRPPFRRH